MSLTPSNCYTSDKIYVGGTAWTNTCTIDVVSIPNTSEVQVKVYPVYEGVVNLTLKEDQVYNFIDFQVPFQITATTIFYTDTAKFIIFKICDLIAPPEPTLYVNYIMVSLDPAGNVPQYNRYGVVAQIALKGTGIGNLKLNWGTDHSETIRGVRESNTTYKYNLPPGQHAICAELFNVV